MPLTLVGGASIASDIAFQGRVAIACYFVAREVIQEDNTTIGNENRVRYARSVIMQDFSEFQKLGALVVTDQTIRDALPATSPNHSQITDVMIINAVRNMWNKLAGVVG